MSELINKEELKELTDYLYRVSFTIPAGLPDLRHAIDMALLDLLVFLRTGNKKPGFERALTFAQSIPRVTDWGDEAFTNWMIHDVEHYKIIDGWTKE